MQRDRRLNEIALHRAFAEHLRSQAKTMTTDKGIALVRALADEWEQKAHVLESHIQNEQRKGG
jgi:hypothetical protein